MNCTVLNVYLTPGVETLHSFDADGEMRVWLGFCSVEDIVDEGVEKIFIKRDEIKKRGKGSASSSSGGLPPGMANMAEMMRGMEGGIPGMPPLGAEHPLAQMMKNMPDNPMGNPNMSPEDMPEHMQQVHQGFSQMMAMAKQNPEMLKAITENPMVKGLLEDPEKLKELWAANPVMKQMMGDKADEMMSSEKIAQVQEKMRQTFFEGKELGEN